MGEQVDKTTGGYPVYVRKPGPKRNVLETWAPKNQKKTFYTVIAIIVAVVVIGFVILLVIFASRNSKCRNAFCKIVENAQQEINSKIIVK